MIQKVYPNLKYLLEYEEPIPEADRPFYERQKNLFLDAIYEVLKFMAIEDLKPLISVQLNRGYLNQLIHYYVGLQGQKIPSDWNDYHYGTLVNNLINNHKKFYFDTEIDFIIHQSDPVSMISNNEKSLKNHVKKTIFSIRTKLHRICPINVIYWNNGKLQNELKKIKGGFNLNVFQHHYDTKKNAEKMIEFEKHLESELEIRDVQLDCEKIASALSIKIGREAIIYASYIEDLSIFIKKYRVNSVLASSSGAPNDLALLIAARRVGIRTYFSHHGFSISNNDHLENLVDIQLSYSNFDEKIPGARVISISKPWM